MKILWFGHVLIMTFIIVIIIILLILTPGEDR